MPYILVIDDDIDARGITMLALQDKGFKCIGAENGLEALNFIFDPKRKSMPYLILLDLNMPVMSGDQFLNVIRGCETMSHIPLIILSGSDVVPEGYRSLQKPVDIQTLCDVAEGARDGAKIR
jgi:CheY-like chemotaxis protein